jgi:hypothetical protein
LGGCERSEQHNEYATATYEARALQRHQSSERRFEVRRGIVIFCGRGIVEKKIWVCEGEGGYASA